MSGFGIQLARDDSKLCSVCVCATKQMCDELFVGSTGAERPRNCLVECCAPCLTRTTMQDRRYSSCLEPHMQNCFNNKDCSTAILSQARFQPDPAHYVQQQAWHAQGCWEGLSFCRVIRRKTCHPQSMQKTVNIVLTGAWVARVSTFELMCRSR